MKWHIDDYDLSASSLEAKYSPEGGGQHPHYTRNGWRGAVVMDETILGYWDWLVTQLNEERDELDRDNPFNSTLSI